MAQLDSEYRKHAAHWQAIYDAVDQILGTSHVVLNFGDQLRSAKVNATAFEVRGNVGGTQPSSLTWNWDAAPYANDTPFDLTDPANWLGHVPVLTLNGTDEKAIAAADDSFYSPELNTASWGAWVNFADATSGAILDKYDPAVNRREWRFGTDSNDKLFVLCSDESAADNASISTAVDSAMTEGVWQFLAATYDGSVDASGLNIYVNGVLVASSDADDANFIAMEDLAAPVMLGATSNTSPGNYLDAAMLGGPLGPFYTNKELSAAEVRELYFVGAQAAGLG